MADAAGAGRILRGDQQVVAVAHEAGLPLNHLRTGWLRLRRPGLKTERRRHRQRSACRPEAGDSGAGRDAARADGLRSTNLVHGFSQVRLRASQRRAGAAPVTGSQCPQSRCSTPPTATEPSNVAALQPNRALRQQSRPCLAGPRCARGALQQQCRNQRHPACAPSSASPPIAIRSSPPPGAAQARPACAAALALRGGGPEPRHHAPHRAPGRAAAQRGAGRPAGRARPAPGRPAMSRQRRRGRSPADRLAAWTSTRAGRAAGQPRTGGAAAPGGTFILSPAAFALEEQRAGGRAGPPRRGRAGPCGAPRLGVRGAPPGAGVEAHPVEADVPWPGFHVGAGCPSASGDLVQARPRPLGSISR